MRVPAARVAVIAATVGAVLVAGSASAAKAPDLVTAAAGGQPVNEPAAQQSISASADGTRIAFVSAAPDLVPGDTNGVPDVFLRDLTAGTLTRISVSIAGAQANRASSNAEISADGAYVVFSSLASNLVSGDFNGTQDVFVRDVAAGTTARVSVTRSGIQGVAPSGEAPSSISADGRFVTFSSRSANLVSADTNGARDVLVLDRSTGVIERANAAADGGQAPSGTDSGASAVSADGRYVVVVTTAALDSSDADGVADVYRRDRQAGATELVSVGTTAAVDLLPDGVSDVYVRDLAAGTTTLASAAPGATAGDGPSTGGRLSADGRTVVFESQAANLVSGDAGADSDVFVRDLDRGVTAIASPGQAGAASVGGDVSADGASVLFTSNQGGIVAGDGGTGWDTFRVDSPLAVPPDTTAPEIHCGTADSAWHAENVALACTASDAGTGLAQSGDAGFALETAVLPGDETADAATGTREVCDLAGNCATAGPVSGIRVDRRAPQIHIDAPIEGQIVDFGADVAAFYGCDDGGSGVSSCAGPVAAGALLPTGAAGSRTFTVDAVDQAGNTSRAAVSWTVREQAPPPPATRRFEFRWVVLPHGDHVEAGSTLHLGFAVKGARSYAVDGAPAVGEVPCGSAARLTPGDEGVEPVDAKIRAFGPAWYLIRWKTEKQWSGTCRQLVLTLTDGSVQRLTVEFRHRHGDGHRGRDEDGDGRR